MTITMAEGGDPGRAMLTHRELDVLRLLRDGLSDREIACALAISPATVRSHLGSLAQKLGVRRRMRIAARGEQYGLV